MADQLSSKHSRFGWIMAPEACTRPDYDTPILSTESFVVLPSLGSLVPGWVLIVPRRPVDNLRRLTPSETAELSELKSVFTTRLEGNFEHDVFCFEHGSFAGSPSACGVDQAHLHLVPLDMPLLELAIQMEGVMWEKIKSHQPWTLVSPGVEYLALCGSDGKALIGYPCNQVSQRIRRLIAESLGKPSEWNYRTHPGTEQMNLTLELLS